MSATVPERSFPDYSFWHFAHRDPAHPLQPTAAVRTAEIGVPALILTAEQDIPACLEIGDLLSKSLPHSRKVVMAGTGHLMHMEKPTEFNQILLDFLASVR